MLLSSSITDQVSSNTPTSAWDPHNSTLLLIGYISNVLILRHYNDERKEEKTKGQQTRLKDNFYYQLNGRKMMILWFDWRRIKKSAMMRCDEFSLCKSIGITILRTIDFISKKHETHASNESHFVQIDRY